MASKCSETTKAIFKQPIQRFRNVIKNSCEYVFTWLDKNSMSSEENLDMQTKMRKIVGDLKIFEDPDACVEYITDLKDQKVVLIVCGSYNHRLISVIHHLSHLSAIYVYCFEKETVEEWSKYYEKVGSYCCCAHELSNLFCLADQRRVYTNKRSCGICL